MSLWVLILEYSSSWVYCIKDSDGFSAGKAAFVCLLSQL